MIMFANNWHFYHCRVCYRPAGTLSSQPTDLNSPYSLGHWGLDSINVMNSHSPAAPNPQLGHSLAVFLSRKLVFAIKSLSDTAQARFPLGQSSWRGGILLATIPGCAHRRSPPTSGAPRAQPPGTPLSRAATAPPGGNGQQGGERHMGRAAAGNARRSRRSSAASASPAGRNRRERGKKAGSSRGGEQALPAGTFDLGAQSERWAAFQERHRLSCEEAARLLLDA